MFGSIEESETLKDALQGEDHDEWDSTQYHMPSMTSWKVFAMMKGAAFVNTQTLRCMLYSLILSVCVAASTHVSAKSDLLSASRMQKMATFMNVFVGLLLGFFLSSSVLRWYGCVNAFLQLLDAVRSMHMQMVALGVGKERSELLSRYGILSAWLLHLSLNITSRKSGEREEQISDSEKLERTWSDLERFRPRLVNPREKERLLHHQECYALLWTWVASLIGRMSQDGEIPPMASPTYGRIIEIVELAYGSIRDVRTLHLVKAPFIYVHTLAVLVHVNHILNSISFGFVMGMTSKVLTDHGEYKIRELSKMVSCLFMQFCMGMVAPFLYLALLDVCVCISQPFTYKDSKIPALPAIKNLEEDITNATVMADNTKWQKPRFKK